MPAYRTAQGKMVDMSQLAARNEKVRAVGNMNVNARGDIVDSHNKVITDNTKRVKASYQKIINEKQNNQAVNNQPKSVPTKNVNIAETAKANELTQTEKEFFDDDEDIVK